MARRKSWNTSEMSYDEVAEVMQKNDTIIIPMGSNEKHGAHCPLGTDSMTTMGVVRVAAPLAKTLHTPLIPVGYSPHHMGEVGQGSGTLTFSGTTYRAVVYELAMSMIYHGFNKIVFVSHHGSNSKIIDDVLRRLRYETGCFVCWYKTPTEREYSLVGNIMEGPPEETPGWHAGELETSTVMAWDEELIDMDKAKQDRTHAPRWMGEKFSKKDGTASVQFMGAENIIVPMEHHEYSDTATIGNPFRGSKEKGERYFQAAGKALAVFIEEVKKFDIKIPLEARRFANRA
ncbi:MAG: creatininase family protein [Spirochaetes bacterium]|mgnify:CR=1 FL=1|nr:MAG: creatininase family protein [Spirochaetota bacterium]